MLIIHHRVNTIKGLEAVPIEYGVEVDVRDQDGELILNHDPFLKGERLEEYLGHYHHSFIIFNIKCEGIERKVCDLAEKSGIKDYFLLDVSSPFLYKLANQGFRKLAVRFSEWEPLEGCLRYSGKTDWVFVDVATILPLDKTTYSKLKERFKICLVSPELWGREEIVAYQKLLKERGIRLDAVLTKKPESWKI